MGKPPAGGDGVARPSVTVSRGTPRGLGGGETGEAGVVSRVVKRDRAWRVDGVDGRLLAAGSGGQASRRAR